MTGEGEATKGAKIGTISQIQNWIIFHKNSIWEHFPNTELGWLKEGIK